MIDLSDCVELGTITKCHGIHGQVVLRLSNLSFNAIKEMEPLFIEIDGLPVPFFVTEFAERSKDTLLLTIDDIDEEQAAKDLIDSRVFITSSQVAIPEIQLPKFHPVDGYSVIDKQLGKLGIAGEILDLDNNPLLRILNNKKEILLPFHDDFIHSINTRDKILYVSIPKGLLDVS